MKTTLLLTSILTVSTFSFAQTIGQIKQASYNHNFSNESSEEASSTYDSDDSYASTNYDYTSTEAATASVTLNGRPHVPRYRDSSGQKALWTLSYWSNIDHRNFAMQVPRVDAWFGGYYVSARVLSLTEQHIEGAEQYQTIDLQFCGLQSDPRKPTSVRLSIGVLIEPYSNTSRKEWVAALQQRIGNKVILIGEGRLASKNGFWTRTEGSIVGRASIIQTDQINLNVDAFFLASLYYEKVPVETYGLGLSLDF